MEEKKKKKEQKLGTLSRKDLRVAKKGRDLKKTFILLLEQTNPNEQNRCPSQSKLVIENSQPEAL